MNKTISFEKFFAQREDRTYRHTEKKMLLAQTIAERMKACGLRKKDLAEKLGKRPSEITKWLSGDHNFTLSTLFELEEALDMQLINLDGEKKEVTYKLPVSESKVSSPPSDYSQP